MICIDLTPSLLWMNKGTSSLCVEEVVSYHWLVVGAIISHNLTCTESCIFEAFCLAKIRKLYLLLIIALDNKIYWVDLQLKQTAFSLMATWTVVQQMNAAVIRIKLYGSIICQLLKAKTSHDETASALTELLFTDCAVWWNLHSHNLNSEWLWIQFAS